MKNQYKRLLLILAALALLGLASALVLSAFQKNLVFFFTPTQVLAGETPHGTSFRIGGMVEQGSLVRENDGLTSSFVVTDNVQRIRVRYRGILPDMFKEGKGVVAQGKVGPDQLFVAQEVLAKHDENYMPPEAAYALKQGQKINANANANALAAGTMTAAEKK